MKVAVITGGSRGFGRALAEELHEQNWTVVITGRDAATLSLLADRLPGAVPVVGDVTNSDHRQTVRTVVSRLGRVDLLVNNASDLGPTPLPPLMDFDLDGFRSLLETNVLAPLALVQLLAPFVEIANGAILNVSSDAASEAYAGWGGYGASKAALDHVTAVLAVENPSLCIYAFDPGDMRTDMHQAAFPGEDISDRPEPSTVVPAVLQLLDRRPPNGRYRAGDLLASTS